MLQTLGAILLGLPAEQSQNQFFNSSGQRTATDYRQFVQHEYATFVQDVWKIRSNLTLSYGLRYQFNGVPFERNANLSNLLDQLPWTAGDKTFQLVGPGTGRQLINNDPYNFEPRIGLAWDPAKDGKTSVRLGYGVFHDRLFGNLFGNIRSDPPFLGSVANYPQTAYSIGAGSLVTLSGLPAPPTVPTPSATVPEGTYLSGVVLLDPNMKNPYSQAWNAGVQHQLRSGMTLSVDYVANNAHRLFRSVDGNPPLPFLIAAGHENGTLPYTLNGPILRLAPEYGYPQVTGNTVFSEPILSKSVGNSNYNSLQVGLNQQFHAGIQFQVNYTWGHAIDDSSDPIVAAAGNRNIARDVFDLQEDRGDSDNDVRQRIVGNFVFESPFGKGKRFLSSGIAGTILGGWQISGLSSAQSGLPYSVYGTEDSQWVGLSNYPDVVGSLAVPAGAPRNQFGPAVTSFANPPFGRKGTFGRNSLVGPRYIDTDAGLHRTFNLTEGFNLQFRAEVFNLFNHVLFSQPDNVLGDTGTFGQSLSTIPQEDGTTSARQIQLALKLNF